MAASDSNFVTFKQLKHAFLEAVYPVGSIYLSMSATSPQTLFGGTWSKIEGRFLMTSDSSYSAGSTGGSNDAIVVSHNHSGSTASAGSHTHSGSTDSDGSHTHRKKKGGVYRWKKEQ